MDDEFIRSGEILQELMAMGAFEPNVNGIKPDEARTQVSSQAKPLCGSMEPGKSAFSTPKWDQKITVSLSTGKFLAARAVLITTLSLQTRPTPSGQTASIKMLLGSSKVHVLPLERQEALVRSNVLPATKVKGK